MTMSPITILQQNRKRLISNFIEQDISDFNDGHTRIFDEYFQQSFEKSVVGPQLDIGNNPYAILALGGYGRKEQSIHSDVDLLFLFQKKIPRGTEKLIQEMVYPLWDGGFQVSHTTRSVADCLTLAGENIEELTSLLDCRFLCGSSQLSSELTTRLQKKVIRLRRTKLASRLLDINQDRHQRFGDSSYLLEPNLKEGQGGLRDYHTMLWIARIKFDLKEPGDLASNGYFTPDEFETLGEALAYVWKIRNRLHYISGRKCDRLYFEYQTGLAKVLDFDSASAHEPVEQLLGSLQHNMEFIKQYQLMFWAELGYINKPRISRRIFRSKTKVDGLTVERNMLRFVSPKELLQTPLLLVMIFKESARLGIPLSADAKRLIRSTAPILDDRILYSVPIVKILESILLSSTPILEVLDEMKNTGFLSRMIPEFDKIISRVQYNEYHLYPVAKHSLRTVHAIRDFKNSPEEGKGKFYHKIYQELSRKKILLLWSALLHDIGKGESGGKHADRGAVLVSRILARFGYQQAEVDTVSFLVREHLILMKTATRRDLNDEETALICAGKIKKITRLKMLYLLTVADALSTGPKAWNDWTEVLLRDLFFKVLKILQTRELSGTRAVKNIERKKRDLMTLTPDAQSAADLVGMFEVMPQRYLLSTDSREIFAHLELHRSLGDRKFVWNIRKDEASDTRTVTICAKDSPGLFSRISGIFTLNNLDILDAQIYTWRDDIALDIFTVKPPLDKIFEDRIWNKAAEDLKDALSEDLDLETLLREKTRSSKKKPLHMRTRPDRVKLDNESSSFFTLIEVFTYDVPGLLFNITNVLYRNRLDIRISKIATKVDQVVDVFYVRGFDGEKIDGSENIAQVKTEILESISSLN